MQIFILLIMVALIIHDAAAADLNLQPRLEGPAMLGAVLGSYIALSLLLIAACGWVRRTLNAEPARAGRAVRRLELVLAFSRMAIVVLFGTQLYVLGYLQWLRQAVGELILVNEIIVLLPPLATLAVGWWAYYPIDRRMREAVMIRQLDRGEPLFPIWTRWQYVLSQVRHQVLLMLVPLLALLAWTQVVDHFLVPEHAWSGYKSVITLAGGFGIFLVAPLMIRHVWDTVPLPDGELRSRLLDLCRRHKVRIRQLLLWRTYGGVVNGAVMGLVGRLRYILLTDGLIERLDDEEVEAVMAHELGHVRRHHMPWLAICAIAILTAWTALLERALIGFESLTVAQSIVAWPYWRTAADVALVGAMLGGWFVAFGYISRRFERQADTFAVQHLAERLAEDRGEKAERIDNKASEIMSRALFRVAALSNSPPDKPSWRHGSITWRVDYLRSLVGVRLDDCSIDAQVRWIRRTCIAAALVALVLTWPTPA